MPPFLVYMLELIKQFSQSQNISRSLMAVSFPTAVCAHASSSRRHRSVYFGSALWAGFLPSPRRGTAKNNCWLWSDCRDSPDFCIVFDSPGVCIKTDSPGVCKFFRGSLGKKNSDCWIVGEKKNQWALKNLFPLLSVSIRCSLMRWKRWAYSCHLFEKFALYVSLSWKIFIYLFTFYPIWILYIGSNNFSIDSTVGYVVDRGEVSCLVRFKKFEVIHSLAFSKMRSAGKHSWFL